jgi:hypothetical protein
LTQPKEFDIVYPLALGAEMISRFLLLEEYLDYGVSSVVDIVYIDDGRTTI